MSGREAVSVRDVTMAFGQGVVLDRFGFSVAPGETLGLLGLNGSGKSTLVKVLAGFHRPLGGEIQVGEVSMAMPYGHASDPAAIGLRFVHQDLALVPDLSALDNLAMGRGYTRRAGVQISWREERRRLRDLDELLGVRIDPMTTAGELSAVDRTFLAIARALQDVERCRLLVLDEPTASLPTAESRRLLGLIRSLNERGVPIVLVSHRLDEVLDVCHRVTVLRDGVGVAERSTAGLGAAQMAELMTGEEGGTSAAARRLPGGPERLRARGLSGAVLDDVDLAVQEARVTGIFGLRGSGVEEIAPLLYGAVRPRAGVVELRDEDAWRTFRPGVVLGRHRVGYVPADRVGHGLIADLPVWENVGLSGYRGVNPLGRLRVRSRVAEAGKVVRHLQVTPPDPRMVIATLSGGNQQKCVLGRWLRFDDLQALVLDHPTAAVDVRSREQIYGQLRTLADAGCAVVVATTDPEECVEVCDQVLVLHGGRLVGSLADDELTVRELLAVAAGQVADSVSQPVMA